MDLMQTTLLNAANLILSNKITLDSRVFAHNIISVPSQQNPIQIYSVDKKFINGWFVSCGSIRNMEDYTVFEDVVINVENIIDEANLMDETYLKILNRIMYLEILK